MSLVRLQFSGNTMPLVMHNGRLADPLNPLAKKLKGLTAKRKKSDDDLMEIQRVEWEGGLYYDPKTGPYVPADTVAACIISGAKQSRRGTLLKASINNILEPRIPLQYSGPRTLEALWADPVYRDVRGVVVAGRRVMRCRPCFPPPWKLTFTLEYDDMNEEDILAVCVDAGKKAGLCEMRPRYGRFAVEIVASNDELVAELSEKELVAV